MAGSEALDCSTSNCRVKCDSVGKRWSYRPFNITACWLLRKQRKTSGGYFILPHLLTVTHLRTTERHLRNVTCHPTQVSLHHTNLIIPVDRALGQYGTQKVVLRYGCMIDWSVYFAKKTWSSDNSVIRTLAMLDRCNIGLILSKYRIPSLNINVSDIK